MTEALLLELLGEAIDPGAPAWVKEITAFDAAAPCGACCWLTAGPWTLRASGLKSGPLGYASLRHAATVQAATVQAATAQPSREAVSSGLLPRPFYGVRLAALERLARALVADPELEPVPAGGSPEAEGLSKETCRRGSATALARGPAPGPTGPGRERARWPGPGRSVEIRARALGGAVRPLAGPADRRRGGPSLSAERFPARRGRGAGWWRPWRSWRTDKERRVHPGAGSGRACSHGARCDPCSGSQSEWSLDEWDLDERSERVVRRSGSAALGRSMLRRDRSATREARAPQPVCRCDPRERPGALPLGELLRWASRTLRGSRRRWRCGA